MQLTGLNPEYRFEPSPLSLAAEFLASAALLPLLVRLPLPTRRAVALQRRRRRQIALPVAAGPVCAIGSHRRRRR